MHKSKKGMLKANSCINREWGRVKGLRKKITAAKRRMQQKKVIALALLEL